MPAAYRSLDVVRIADEPRLVEDGDEKFCDQFRDQVAMSSQNDVPASL